MQLYGNSRTRLIGIVREKQQRRVKIEFPQCKEYFSIPNLLIHSPIQEDFQNEQEFEIDTWFLKKNRIIPLN